MANTLTWKKIRTLSDKQRKRLQEKKLARMMQLFEMTPYYHTLLHVEHIDPKTIRTMNDISKLPFTSKKDLLSTMEHPEKSHAFVVDPTSKLRSLPGLSTLRLFFSSQVKKDIIREFKPRHVLFSSGTDAAAIPVVYTQCDLARLRESAHRTLSAFSLSSAARYVNVFAYNPDILFWHAYYGLESHFGVHTGGIHSMSTQRMLALLERTHAQLLTGTPSSVMHLILLAHQRGANLEHLRSIHLGGELVTPQFIYKLRELLAGCRATHVTVLSSYHFAEAKVVWGQCHAESGYHLYPDMEYIEIVDEGGHRVAPGETGEIVYTSLDFRGTLFLRYKTGDYGSLEVGPCPHCKCTSPRLSPIITRSDQIVSFQKNKTKKMFIDGNAINAFLQGLHYITESYVVLTSSSGKDILHIYAASRDGESDQYVRKEISRQMQDRFNITPQVHIKDHAHLVSTLHLDKKHIANRLIDQRK